MPRRLLVPAALVAALVVAAAASARDPLGEQRKITKADNALAAGAVLHASDLPAGFVRKASSKDGSTGTCGIKQPDLSSYTITGESRRTYEDRRSYVTVVAGVQVFRSVQDARGDFVKGALPAFTRCLEKIATDEGMRIRSSTFARGVGVGERSVRYRVVATVKNPSGDVPVYLDMLAAQQGRAQTMVVTIAPVRAPSGQELLLELMSTRAARSSAS